nr:DUF2764 family protein [Bacteroidota bacterium]
MMFKPNYYYLVAGLPDLLLDEGRVKISLPEMKAFFADHVQSEDNNLITMLFRKYDNKNLMNLLLKNDEKFDDRGNYTFDFLEEQIKEPDARVLPYLMQFINNFKQGIREFPDISLENELETLFYQYLLTLDNPFLKSWFDLKLNIANVAAALNCREHKMPSENELIGDNAVVQGIIRSNARDFGLMQDFPEIEKILHAWEGETMLDREKSLDLMRWQWIDDATFFNYFSIERILGFLLQLEMVERWMLLGDQEGEEMFRKLLNTLVDNYELPDEFRLQYVTRK